MRPTILVHLLLNAGFAVLLLAGDAAAQQAKDCTCPGKPDGARLEGGNLNPLRWRSELYVYQERQFRTYCYLHVVESSSGSRIPIYWPAAGIEAKFGPMKGSPYCRPTRISVPPDKAPKGGPIYYGPRRDTYPAETYVPQGGWESFVKAGMNVAIYSATAFNPRPIELNVSFFASANQADDQVNNLTLRSFFDTAKGYTYSLQLHGNEPVAVVWNFSKNAFTRKYFPILDGKTFLLKPGQEIRVSVPAIASAQREMTLVQVRSLSGETLFTGFVESVAVTDGSPDISPLMIWPPPRKSQ